MVDAEALRGGHEVLAPVAGESEGALPLASPPPAPPAPLTAAVEVQGRPSREQQLRWSPETVRGQTELHTGGSGQGNALGQPQRLHEALQHVHQGMSQPAPPETPGQSAAGDGRVA